jgi:hypothetical protein
VQWLSELHAAIDKTVEGEYLVFTIGDEKSALVNWQKLQPDSSHMTWLEDKSEKQKY